MNLTITLLPGVVRVFDAVPSSLSRDLGFSGTPRNQN